MRLPALLLSVAAAPLLAACGSTGGDGSGGMLSGLGEIFGGSDPVRHSRVLDRLHEPRTWRHEPDVPPTWDSCLEEIRVLREAEYEGVREAGAAAYVLARCVPDDPSALHRAEAVGALARVAAVAGPAGPEGSAGEAPSEEEIARAVGRLQALHDPKDGLHVSAEARAECAAVLRTAGGLRLPAPAVPSEEESRRALRLLRGTLLAVLVETSSADAHGDGDLRAAAERAVAHLSREAAGRALAAAAHFDRDERVRGDAIEALAALRPEGAVAALRAQYPRERSETVRQRLVRALGGAASPGADPASADAFAVLVVALDDDASAVRWSAREALRGVAGRDLGDLPEPWKRWWREREETGP